MDYTVIDLEKRFEILPVNTNSVSSEKVRFLRDKFCGFFDPTINGDDLHLKYSPRFDFSSPFRSLFYTLRHPIQRGLQLDVEHNHRALEELLTLLHESKEGEIVLNIDYYKEFGEEANSMIYRSDHLRKMRHFVKAMFVQGELVVDTRKSLILIPNYLNFQKEILIEYIRFDTEVKRTANSLLS